VLNVTHPIYVGREKGALNFLCNTTIIDKEYFVFIMIEGF